MRPEDIEAETRRYESSRVLIAGALTAFAWDNFGFSDVGEAVRNGSTEWIQALSGRIATALNASEANRA